MMKRAVEAIEMRAAANMASFRPVKIPKSIVVVLPKPVSIVFEPRMTLGTQLWLKKSMATATGKPRIINIAVMKTVMTGVICSMSFAMM